MHSITPFTLTIAQEEAALQERALDAQVRRVLSEASQLCGQAAQGGLDQLGRSLPQVKQAMGQVFAELDAVIALHGKLKSAAQEGREESPEPEPPAVRNGSTAPEETARQA